jgi:hypothetical protein
MKTVSIFTYPGGKAHRVNTDSGQEQFIVTVCGHFIAYDDARMEDGFKQRQKPEAITCKHCLRGQ